MLDRLKRLEQVDITVILNDNAGTRVMIVAFPVGEELASISRMKAKKENKKTPDTAYF